MGAVLNPPAQRPFMEESCIAQLSAQKSEVSLYQYSILLDLLFVGGVKQIEWKKMYVSSHGQTAVDVDMILMMISSSPVLC